MPRKSSRPTPHDEAVAIIENLVTKNLGGKLEATASCNQCSEEITINLVLGASSVSREKLVGAVRPDISLLDENGEPLRFIEIVDTHAPEGAVHEQALNDGTEVVEIRLRAEREFTGTRRNRALDVSLTMKARLQELAAGRIVLDAHNLLCRRPKCRKCGASLPLRTVTVSTKDCWKCGQNVNVATGDKDGESLEQGYFTKEEIEFARGHGVTLERRFSSTAGGKYLANVCSACDQIQGNWFLYMDPYHDRFNLHKAERQVYGPCDGCAMRYCMTHGEYMDYGGSSQCPSCLEEAERVMCPNNPDRECFYPHKCEAGGCYFLNREQQRREQLEQEERQQRIEQERREQQQRERHAQYEQEKMSWAELQEWFDRHKYPKQLPSNPDSPDPKASPRSHDH